MKLTLSAFAVVFTLAGSSFAEPLAQLGSAASVTEAAAVSGSLEAASAGNQNAFGETAGKGAVAVAGNGTRGDFAASRRLDQAGKEKGFKEKTVPAPKPGIISRAGSALSGIGAKLKPYVPHMLAGGIGMAAGAVTAKVAGAALLGSVLTGGVIGVAALYLHSKGQTGAAIGAASFGLAGLAVGGPVGGLVGALVGGLGAWLIGKFLYS